MQKTPDTSTIPAKQCREASGLAAILSEEYVLYAKTKIAGSGAKGPDRYEKSLFFEGQFAALGSIIERLAERTRSLGYYADAMLQAFVSVTRFSAKKSGNGGSERHIRELVADHESLIALLKGHVHLLPDKGRDASKGELMRSLWEEHENMALVLQLHLKQTLK